MKRGLGQGHSRTFSPMKADLQFGKCLLFHLRFLDQLFLDHVDLHHTVGDRSLCGAHFFPSPLLAHTSVSSAGQIHRAMHAGILRHILADINDGNPSTPQSSVPWPRSFALPPAAAAPRTRSAPPSVAPPVHACKKRMKTACDTDGIFRLHALNSSTILHLSQLISFTRDGPEFLLRRGWSIRETEGQGQVHVFPVEPQHFANIIVQNPAIAVREGRSPYTTPGS